MAATEIIGKAIPGNRWGFGKREEKGRRKEEGTEKEKNKEHWLNWSRRYRKEEKGKKEKGKKGGNRRGESLAWED